MRLNSLLLAVLVACFGCAPSNPGLTIDGVLVPGDSCDYTPTSPFIVEAVLDTNPDVPMRDRPAGVRYVAVLRVANHLINTANRVYPLQADPNVLSLESAEIEVQNSDGTRFAFDGLPNPYRVPAIGTIASTTSSEPQLGISVVEVLPPQYGAGLAGLTTGTLLLSIRVIGVTAGGATLVSGRTLLPLRLCSGCLFQCAVDMMGVPIIQPSCSPGQDRVSLIATCP